MEQLSTHKADDGVSELKHGIPFPPEIPSPTPEHQRKITGQKRFEVALVVLLVVAGTAFLMWRNAHTATSTDPANSLEASANAMVGAGCKPSDRRILFHRPWLTFTRELNGLTCHINLGAKTDESPLETAVIWLTTAPGQSPLDGQALQNVVDSVVLLARNLVQSAPSAVDTAVKTSELITAGARSYDKGVGSTRDGWKVTYVTFRSFDETSPQRQPVLFLVLQRLSAASDEELAAFNQALHEAVVRGDDLEVALAPGRSAP